MAGMVAAAKRRLRMQVRATPDRGPGEFQAKVSTYGLEYDIGWGWTEEILAGCFADSIRAHPTIPVFYNHDWNGAPIGSGQPTEADTDLTVDGRLYLGQGDLVERVYQAMLDGALEEWSIGFWPETITNDKDRPYCDQITRGDLAEASVCVRGANPDTGTLELAGRPAWIVGDESERRREVGRLRRLFQVPDLGRRRAAADDDEMPDPGELAQSVDALIDQIGVLLEDGDVKGAQDMQVAADSACDDLLEALGVPDDDGVEESERARAAGHTHTHRHADGTEHSHAHTHAAGNYGHDGADPEVAHAHSHAGDNPGDGGLDEDPGPDEASRLMATPQGRDRLRHLRSSRPAPSAA